MRTEIRTRHQLTAVVGIIVATIIFCVVRMNQVTLQGDADRDLAAKKWKSLNEEFATAMSGYMNLGSDQSASEVPYKPTGKVICVTWDEDEKRPKIDESYRSLPKELQAAHPDEVEVVVQIKPSLLPFGYVPAGLSGVEPIKTLNQIRLKCAIINRQTGEVYSKRMFRGALPPDKIRFNEPIQIERDNTTALVEDWMLRQLSIARSGTHARQGVPTVSQLWVNYYFAVYFLLAILVGLWGKLTHRGLFEWLIFGLVCLPLAVWTLVLRRSPLCRNGQHETTLKQWWNYQCLQCDKGQ